MSENEQAGNVDINDQHPVEQNPLPRFGHSLLWLPVFGFAYFFAAILYISAAGAIIGLQHPGLTPTDLENLVDRHIASPQGIAGMYLVQFCLLMPLLLLASHFRTRSWRETLAFNRFSLKSLKFWLLVLITYLLLQALVNSFFDISPTVFLESISGSQSLSLTLVVITLAPLMEELLFRGYLYQAWRHSRLGLAGTLLLTSALFAVLHWNQYHWAHLVFVFMLSMILGLSREKTGSVWMPITLHSVNNFLSAVFVIYLGIL